MKSILTLLIFTLSTQLFAHGDHGHSHEPAPMGKSVEEKRLPTIAKVYIATYVKRGALDKSWLDAKHMTNKMTKNKGKSEWIVSFSNAKAKDEKKKKLYVFMRLDGKLIAANFTGK